MDCRSRRNPRNRNRSAIGDQNANRAGAFWAEWRALKSNFVPATGSHVRSRWRDPSHENTLILENGPPQRRDAIVGYAYKRISRERRNGMLNAIISTAAAETGADRVAVIGIDCDEPNGPYSVLAFVPSIKLDPGLGRSN